MSAAREYRLVARLADTDYGESWRGVASGPEGPVPAFIALLAPHVAEAAVVGALGERVRALQAVGHPGLLVPWEVGRAGDRVVVTAPYADGYDLGTVFSRQRAREIAVSLGRAVAVLAEAADAVAALHAAGIAHGSLVPTNVFVCFDGRIRVACANVHPALEASKASRHLALRGRKPYRAPELARSGASDVLTDVYALGALLYELATGKSLEGAGSRGTSTRADALPVPSRVDRRIPMKFDPVVGKALETARTRRYKDAGVARDGLQAWLDTMGHPVSRDDLAELAATVMPNEVVRFLFDPREAGDPMAPLPAGFTVTPLARGDAAGPRRYDLATEAPAAPAAVAPAPPAPAPSPTAAPAPWAPVSAPPPEEATVKADALGYPGAGTDAGSLTQPGRGPDLGFPEAAPPVAAPGPATTALDTGPVPPAPALGHGDTVPAIRRPRLGDPAADGWFRDDTREVKVLHDTDDLGAPLPGDATDDLGDPLGGGKTLGNTAYRLTAMEKRSHRGLYLGAAVAAVVVLGGAALALGRHRGPAPAAPSPTAAVADAPAPARPIRPLAPAPREAPAAAPRDDAPAAPERHAERHRTRVRHGLLTIYANHRARVFLDGHDLHRRTPLRGLRVPAGHHELLLVDPIRHLHRRLRIHVRPGRLTRLHLRL